MVTGIDMNNLSRNNLTREAVLAFTTRILLNEDKA